MGRWFGRKSAASDARPFVPAWLKSADEEVGFARSYSEQFEEVFRRNPVGQRAVRLVAGMLGSLTIDAVEGDARAAELLRADGLLEGIAANLLLHGNSYVQPIADGRDVPAELCLIRPERVSVVCDERGWPVAYLYRAGGQVVRYERADALGRQQLAHIKALSPRDDHYGAGCLDAAIAAASVHNRAAKWNKALLDNAARPSGALSYEPADGAVMSADQFRRLKEELTEEFSGTGNAGRPLLLEGGLKWQALSLTPPADPSMMDTPSNVEVQLIDVDQWLVSCDDDALVAGANLALIGEELLQFADVTPLGGGRFGLARLLRGRLGTDAAVSAHVSSELFCLIETGSLQSIPLPITSIGTEVTAQIAGGASMSVTVSPRAEAIASPSGGATIDDQARAAIDQILATMRQQGQIDG